MLVPFKSNHLSCFVSDYSCDSALLGHPVESSGGIGACGEKLRVAQEVVSVCTLMFVRI